MNWINQPQRRSIPCSGDVIRFYRNKLQWTQQELAESAGYTKRVIAKAESGGSLSPDTIAVIAEALSFDGQTVFPEDITSSPREMTAAILRAITEFEGEAVEHCRHLLSEDLQVYFPGGSELAPLSGVHKGIDNYSAMMRTFFKIFQRHDKEIARNTAVISADGNRAVLSCFEKLANEFIPIDADAGPLSLFIFCSRGKITRIQYLFDTMPFGMVVTAWREKYLGSGVENTNSRQYINEISNMRPWLEADVSDEGLSPNE